MKVVLVKAPSAFDEQSRNRDLTVFTLAIYHLAGILRSAGIEVRTLDSLQVDDAFLYGSGLEETFAGADIAGFSVNSFNLEPTRTVVQRLKTVFPEIRCLVGGVHVTYYAEQTLRYTGADFALVGESDNDIVHFCRAYEKQKLDEVPALRMIDAEGRLRSTGIPSDAPKIETVAWSPYLDDLPTGAYHMAPLETSRGCRYSCTFCSILGKRSWRGRDPEAVLDAIEAYPELLQGRVITDGILFTDDCFTGGASHAEAVLAGYCKRGVRSRLMFEARIMDVVHNLRLLDSIAEAQPYGIEFGIECGYDEGLRMIRKGLNTQKIRECLDRLRERGLTRNVRLSFIVGLPFERYEDIERTLAFAAFCVERYDCTSSVAWWIPAPSQLWDELREHGMIPDEDVFYSTQYERDPHVFRQYHANVRSDEVRKVTELLRFYYSMGLALLDIRTLPTNRPRVLSEPTEFAPPSTR